MSTNDPLVSIVTPVYNGEKYLAECIESVLAQTYQNWEYTIVNNCSTDKSFEIAQSYADRDKRIRVVNNHQHVGVIENHNIAFRHISRQSKYCKVVSADDWIYPECITKLVDLAECNAVVGIVMAYSINSKGVRWPGLPVDATIIPGREACRFYLLGNIEFAGSPSSLLYRSDSVRSEDPFFPGSNPNADAAACLNCLQVSDLGFVPQILSFERVHDEAVSAKVRKLGSHLVDRIDLFIRYAPTFLTREEFKGRLEEILCDHYSALAAAVFNFRSREFWDYHESRLREIGLNFDKARFVRAVIYKMADLLLNPKQTIEKILRRKKAGKTGSDQTRSS